MLRCSPIPRFTVCLFVCKSRHASLQTIFSFWPRLDQPRGATTSQKTRKEISGEKSKKHGWELEKLEKQWRERGMCHWEQLFVKDSSWKAGRQNSWHCMSRSSSGIWSHLMNDSVQKMGRNLGKRGGGGGGWRVQPTFGLWHAQNAFCILFNWPVRADVKDSKSAWKRSENWVALAQISLKLFRTSLDYLSFTLYFVPLSLGHPNFGSNPESP